MTQREVREIPTLIPPALREPREDAEEACCEPTKKATCCAPSAKSACCGPTGAGKKGCC
jgi:hypothetical protein